MEKGVSFSVEFGVDNLATWQRLTAQSRGLIVGIFLAETLGKTEEYKHNDYGFQSKDEFIRCCAEINQSKLIRISFEPGGSIYLDKDTNYKPEQKIEKNGPTLSAAAEAVLGKAAQSAVPQPPDTSDLRRLSELEAICLAPYLISGWTRGNFGVHEPLPLLSADSGKPRSTLQSHQDLPENAAFLFEPICNMLIDYCGEFRDSMSPRDIEANCHARIHSLLNKIFANKKYCGDNPQKRSISLEWLAAGDSTGPGGRARLLFGLQP